MIQEKTRSRILFSTVLLASLITMRCAAGKPQPASVEPVVAAAAVAPTVAPVKPTEPGVIDTTLPPELQNAQNFDPASTIDPNAVKNSDFFQVKKEAETNRTNLEKDWKMQDDQEESVKKAKEAEKLKQDQDQKKDDEAREESRMKSVKEHKSSAAQRARFMREANDRVKKMPTITKQEIQWNGLED